MNAVLLTLGVLAWAGVAALSVAIANVAEDKGFLGLEQPVWGFFPILAAVFVAWAIGEYVTERVWKED